MKKTKEIMMAEQVVAQMIRENPGNPRKVLEKAYELADNFRFSIARQVDDTIWMLTLHDFYDDMTKERMKELHDAYLDYFESFNDGNEDIFRQMLEINEMLDGKLMDGKIFEVINERSENEH